MFAAACSAPFGSPPSMINDPYSDGGGVSDASGNAAERAPEPSESSAFLILPLNMSDVGYESFVLNPFGIHIAEHGSDGHPGFDFEFRPGAKALVVADGVVSSVFADIYDPTASTVQLEHTIGKRRFRTVYTNIAEVEGAIVIGATVKQGDVLGTPKAVSRTYGERTVTYAMTHLQLDDFDRHEGLSNPNAVSPESYFVAQARDVLTSIWQRAAYNQEVCEPFLSNARGTTTDPTHVRTWVAASSTAAIAKFEMACAHSGKGTAYAYRLLNDSNVEIEGGVASVVVQADGSTCATLTPKAGAPRSVVYTIVDEKMSVRFGEPGGTPPSSIDGADVYTTTR